MKRCLLLAMSCLMLLACSQQEEAQYTRTEQESATLDPNTWVKADLLCEEIRNADDSNPLAVVFLRLLEQQYLLDTVYTCSVIAPQMYISYDIPRHALSACGGWWAGKGTFYYALQEGDSITVMHAKTTQGDSLGFQYTLRGRFPVTFSGSEPEDAFMP